MELDWDLTESLSSKLRYPLRTEGVEMVAFVLGRRRSHERGAQIMLEELERIGFLDKERRYANHPYMVKWSLRLLRSIVACDGLLPDLRIEQTRGVLESLEVRFIRQPIDLSVFEPKELAEEKRSATVIGARVEEDFRREIVSKKNSQLRSKSAFSVRASYSGKSPR
jgi:tRNA nucleotidyltransferase (CCA-adding enzyme)